MKYQARQLRVIFFDAAGTLFRVHGSVGEIYARFARRHGFQCDPEALEDAFRAAFGASPKLAFPPMNPDELVAAERLWWFEIVRKVLGDRMTPAGLLSCFEELFRFFGGPEAWQPFPDTIPALQRLSGQGFRLGVISNFDSRLLAVLRGLSLDPFFERVIFSSQAGAAKPDTRIFLGAVAAMGVEPGECLHVGDTIEEDLRGAERAGLQAVVLDRENRHAREVEMRRIAIEMRRIASLEELQPSPNNLG